MPEITELLEAWNKGDLAARDELFALVNPELKKMAHDYMRKERSGHILETNGLIGEATLRLIRENLNFANRKHFYAIVSKRMSQILKRHAHSITAERRKGLSEAERKLTETAQTVIDLDEAIQKLRKSYSREAEVFIYRFVLGLKLDEIAKLLGIAVATVQRDLRFARAWLKKSL